MDYPKMYLYRRIVNAKSFIDRHYARQIQLDEISNEACFSKFHFVRLFKEVYGKSPNQYLFSVRMQAARRYLQNGMNVSDVCHAVGFNSVPSFIAAFKKEFEISPKNYAIHFTQRASIMNTEPLKFVPGCFSKKLSIHI